MHNISILGYVILVPMHVYTVVLQACVYQIRLIIFMTYRCGVNQGECSFGVITAFCRVYQLFAHQCIDVG